MLRVRFYFSRAFSTTVSRIKWAVVFIYPNDVVTICLLGGAKDLDESEWRKRTNTISALEQEIRL